MRLPIRCVIVAFAVIPASAGAAEPPAHRLNGDLAIRARDIVRRHCSECHTGGDAVGQSRVKLIDHAKLTAKKTPIPLVDPKGRSLVLDLVKDGSMPPANRPGPTADEVAVLEKWVKAGAPAYPLAFDEEYVLNAIADDFEQELAKSKDAGEFIRYASLAHLVQDGKPLPDLRATEGRLLVALAASRPPNIQPPAVELSPLVALDPAATVLRVDVRTLHWRTREVFEKQELRKDVGVFRLQPFDLLLMEYPFAQQLSDGPVRKRLDELLTSTAQVRPVPFVRGDWLADVLVSDQASGPLAGDVKSLAGLEVSFARKTDVPPDGPITKPFTGAKPVVVSAADGRTPIPPLSAWYAGDVTPEKAPFTLKAELVSGGKPIAGVKVDQPFGLRVSCDKKVHLMLLMVQADGEPVVQPVEGGTVLLAGKERTLAPNAVGLQITSILGGGDSGVEHLVLFASQTPLPAPTILRSKHADKYIWRFLMEPTEKDKFDPNAVVRKVIPVKVTNK